MDLRCAQRGEARSVNGPGFLNEYPPDVRMVSQDQEAGAPESDADA